MKRALLLSFACLMVMGSVSTQAAIGSGSERDSSAREMRDPTPVPFPWGSEMPFPWSFIQGVWLAEYGELRSYFSFKVVTSGERGIKQLEVKQIDPVTCKQVASGAGLESNRVVRAVMNNPSRGFSYRLALRAFSDEEVDLDPRYKVKPIRGQYVILSVLPFDSAESAHIPISQVSNRLDFKCKVQQ